MLNTNYYARKALAAAEEYIEELKKFEQEREIKMKNNVQMFSELMAEELDRQFWGAIDPNLFHEIAENANSNFENMSEDAQSLAKIIR